MRREDSKARTYYTTIGDVCGACEHRHRSAAAADACALRHHRAIRRGNVGSAYSDRRVVAVDDGRVRELDEHERDQVAAASEATPW